MQEKSLRRNADSDRQDMDRVVVAEEAIRLVETNTSEADSGETTSVEHVSPPPDSPVSQDEAEDTLPDLGDDYEVLAKIAQGGMGDVFKVRQKLTGQMLAVKTMQAELTKDNAALKRFQQEAEAAMKLTHPNLVAVLGHGTAPGGVPYIIMEYHEGENLAHLVEISHGLEPERALKIFKQIAEGLQYAHENGVIHRDIKPTNVIITKVDGEDFVRLVDFGIATTLPSQDRETRDLTRTGEVFGSPHYMSPEQCLGFMTDQRSDLYSFGCLMYETLTGAAPFSGNNPIQLVVKHINDDPKRFSRELKTGKLVDKLESITFRCLEKDPLHRFQSAKEVFSDLELARLGKPIPKYVKGAKVKPSLTRNQMLGALGVLGFIMTALPMTPLLSWDIRSKIVYGSIFLVSSGAIYAFFSTAVDKTRKLDHGKATPRHWYSIVLLFSLGAVGLGWLPYLVRSMVMDWSDEPNVLTAGIFFGEGLIYTGALFAIVSIIAFLTSRSSARISFIKASRRIALLMVPLLMSLVFCFPKQVSTQLQQLNWSGQHVSPEASMAILKTASFLDGKNPRIPSAMAEIPKDKKEGVAILTSFLKSNPESWMTYSDRADFYSKLQQFDKAEADATTVIEKKPEATYSDYNLRARIRGQKGDFIGASSDYAQSMTLNPSYENEAWKLKVGSYCSKKMYEEALTELQEMRRMAVKEDWHVIQALVLEQMDRTAEAKAEYEQVIKMYQDQVQRNALSNDSYIDWRTEQMAAFSYHRLGKDNLAQEKLPNANRRHNDIKSLLNLEFADLKPELFK